MDRGAGEVHARGRHEPAVDAGAVAEGGPVRLRLGQALDERALGVVAEEAREIEGARGPLEDLDGFDAVDVVEEPAAAREHGEALALERQQAQGARFFFVGKRSLRMFG